MADEPTSYDRVPYRSLAFAQTHPDRLATIARIFGVPAPDVDRCRVLELGCASGANLIPLAFNLPGSEFVGIDLSQRQVAEARAAIEALGLRNIRIEHGSLEAIDASWGSFDYIICHGVFSWVEAPVQDRIFRIASDNLSPFGVAYISYNTYPGWHMRETIRDMMRYHTQQFDDPQEQIEQARALLAFMTAAAEGSGPYEELLRREIQRLNRANDSYLYHEHLEQTNTPIYFHQFMERAARTGLMYLSEASISDMLTTNFPPAVAQTLDRISPNILHLEQYMDFVRNRQFRQTLLVHDTVAPKRSLSPAVLHGMLVSSRASAGGQPVDLSPGRPAVFRIGDRRLETTEPVTKAAFAILIDASPRGIPVDDLCHLAIARVLASAGAAAPAERLRKTLMEQLFQCVIGNMAELHTFQAPFATEPGERPRANRFAAWQAREHETVVNAFHETVKLDELSRVVMQLADGSRTRGEIVDVLVERVAAGAMQVHTDGGTIADPSAARPLLRTAVDQVIVSLARAALLTDAA